MRIDAELGVADCWLIDPLARTLEIYSLRDEHWQRDGAFEAEERVRAAPFEAIELELAGWWLPEETAD